MRAVRAEAVFPATVHQAEEVWYDTSRWPEWVDGLEEVVSVEGPWPERGSLVRWRSVPAGRGDVTERALAHEPLGGQSLDVEDESVRGSQRVEFTPIDGGVQVTLTLEYDLKQPSVFTRLSDRLFIKRAIASSLQTTLSRFGGVLGERTRE